MNGAARTVILKAVVQLEVERHLLVRRCDALAAEMRDYERRLDAIAIERGDLLAVTGELSPEERVMIASTRDFPGPAATAPPARARAGRTRKATALRNQRGPAPDELPIIVASYSVEDAGFAVTA